MTVRERPAHDKRLRYPLAAAPIALAVGASGCRSGGDGGFSSEGDSVAGVGCGGGQIPYDLLLAQTDHVMIEDDGTASFESSKDEPLLTLSPTP